MITKFFEQVFEALADTSHLERIGLLIIVICIYHCVAYMPHSLR